MAESLGGVALILLHRRGRPRTARLGPVALLRAHLDRRLLTPTRRRVTPRGMSAPHSSASTSTSYASADAGGWSMRTMLPDGSRTAQSRVPHG